MLKVLIIEDNATGAALLNDKIEKNFLDKLTVVGIVGTVSEAIRSIETQKPDLLFLDIHLLDGDGFEVLEQTQGKQYDVIFTTAYQEYSLKAFDYSALHYLLKPIEERELINAIHRFLEKKTSLSYDQVQLFKQQIQSGVQKIAISSMTEIVFVLVDDIMYFEADQNYSKIYLKDGKMIVSTKSLAFYEDLLLETAFYRIHGKYLINTNCVIKYIKGKGGSVLMPNKMELPVSVRKKQGFIHQMLKSNA
ncbi:LytR/AlgR family response regulator transcription factor [Aureispira anguillae]|uniref:LytTR family DNA-binding domain-containing protein n=1 Tax=Aureispira anguillae TaxID=2864201 RepID=A0A915YEY6_9BACT|nr:LytTR family DNA-binding domain-containing protein [Aureispira anguillae]BDS11761.1 LytTR family DNA-binding domain-containing protein [Aureispira anguillae]